MNNQEFAAKLEPLLAETLEIMGQLNANQQRLAQEQADIRASLHHLDTIFPAYNQFFDSERQARAVWRILKAIRGEDWRQHQFPGDRVPREASRAPYVPRQQPTWFDADAFEQGGGA